MTRGLFALALAGLGTFGVAALAGCPQQPVDTSGMNESIRADYQLFQVRCSKCHSLARPLQSGITDDAQWEMYVTRMRRQPGSGISQEDQTAILRFLHWYSEEQKKKKAGSGSPTAAPPASSAPPAEPPGGH